MFLRNTFFILPAMTVVYVLSNAVPVSDLLRALATKWKEATHWLIRSCLDWIPFLPPIEFPNFVLDQISFALLISGSLLSRYIFNHIMKNVTHEPPTLRQYSPRTYWLSVLILGFVFFAIYDVQYYLKILEGPNTTADLNLLELWAGKTTSLASMVLGSLVWIFLILSNLISVPGPRYNRSGEPKYTRYITKYDGSFKLFHGMPVISPILLLQVLMVTLIVTNQLISADDSGSFWTSLTVMLLITVLLIWLRFCNRNSIVITLLLASGIIVSDVVLSILVKVYNLAIHQIA